MRLLYVVIVLAALGLAAAALRGLVLFGVLDSPTVSHQAQAFWADLSVRITDAELAAFNQPFDDHPIVAALHILPALVFMTLAPLQFSSTIRARHARFHRWSGRALVLLGISLGISGLFFGLRTPFGGTIEAYGVAVAGMLFLGGMIKAFAAVRAGDITRHRIWMTRAFAVALSISTMRLVLPVLLAVTGAPVQSLFGLSVWIGLLVTVCTAELWLRRKEVGGYT